MLALSRVFRFCEAKGFSQRRISTKHFGIFRNEMALFLSPLTAKLEEKGSSVIVTSQGAMRFELVPFQSNENGKTVLISHKKQAFFAAANHISNFLSISDDDIRNKAFKTKLEYQNRSRWMLVSKESEASEYITLEISGTKSGSQAQQQQEEKSRSALTEQTQSIKLNKSELVVMRQLCSYCLPFLLGWHLLNPTVRVSEHLGHA